MVRPTTGLFVELEVERSLRTYNNITYTYTTDYSVATTYDNYLQHQYLQCQLLPRSSNRRVIFQACRGEERRGEKGTELFIQCSIL